ncbi:MAG: hypothetical protein COA42_12800 [Alteromonadaceae bacterium]|nr:MAG: hypothetical protein COA42_12800 [Alteromonadaceae bacterium]
MLTKLKLKLGAKLILVAALCIVPLSIVVGYVLANYQRELLLSTVNTSLDITLNFVKDAIQRDLYHMQNKAQTIATDPKLRRALDTASSLGINSRLNHIAKIQPQLNYILLIDETKSVFAATTFNHEEGLIDTAVLLGNSIIEHPMFGELLSSQVSISRPGKDPYLPQVGLANSYTEGIIAPVNIRGTTQGWVVLSYKFEDTFSTLLQGLIKRLQTLGYPVISSSIINSQGKILAATESSAQGLIRKVNMTLGDSSVQLIIKFNRGQVLAPLKTLQTTIFIAFGILLTLLGLSLFLVINYILLRPIRCLDEAAVRLTRGELGHRLNLPGSDELTVLAQTFNAMAEQIEGTHSSLEANVARRTKQVEEASKQLAIQNTALETINANLERSNKDLNDFAYVASHDLKAPLRGITQLAEWIEDDIHDSAEDQTKEYLALMKNRVLRLDRLLDDLLNYSRAGNKHGGLKEVSIADLANDVFQLLAPPPDFRLVCEQSLPTLVTLSVPLEVILRNLIDNAIKHHNSDKGTIHISAKSEEDGFEFVVSDDGPGIELTHHNRVFEIFKTLKPRDEVEGSGIGLAIVKKLLTNYESNIIIDSDGVNGTKMCFSWPAENKLRRIINAE